MEHSFWHDRWNKNEIAFHEGEANALLVAHFAALGLPEAARVFVPLCGKTRDIAWLLSQGMRVVGVELNATAVTQLFDELGVTPTVTELTGADGVLHRYSTPGLDVFTGDIFLLTEDMLGPVDAVYDRAALVALPQDLRNRYTRHLRAITRHAPQLLITFEYDQSAMSGPPFSIPQAEVGNQYGADFTITGLAQAEVPNKLKGVVPATEAVWHLTPNGHEQP